MELLVQLGPARLSILQAIPGRPGEALRTWDALRKLDPDLVAVELTFQEALKMEDALLKGAEVEPTRHLEMLLREGLARFGRVERGSPFLQAARYAKDNKLLYLPLSPKHEEPGAIRRWRQGKALDPAGILAEDEEAYARALFAAARRDDWYGERLAGEERLIATKLVDVMEREQRTRVALVCTYPRGERIAEHLRDRGFAPARKDGLVPWETR